MLVENNILLAANAFTAAYLCVNSLQEINRTSFCPGTLPFYLNYFAFGVSIGMIISVTKHIK